MSEMETVGGDDLELDWPAVLQAVRELSTVDDQHKSLGRRKEELKSRLRALTLNEGFEDDKGHLRLELPEQVGNILALQIQRRRSNVFDAERAEEILKSISVDTETLWDRCVTMVPVLDEDKVMASHYEGLLTEEQIDEMYPESVTEAFVPVKVRK